jgi:hypothetical protein
VLAYLYCAKDGCVLSLFVDSLLGVKKGETECALVRGLGSPRRCMEENGQYHGEIINFCKVVRIM